MVYKPKILQGSHCELAMIIEFLRRFRHVRDLEETVGACRDNLREQMRSNESLTEELRQSSTLVENERIRRISAESIAVERSDEIQRLLKANEDLRQDLRSVVNERVRSVDAINLKLMETKIPERPVDFKEFHGPVTKLRTNLVNDIRAQHRALDMAVLEQAKKGFPNRKRTMNEKTGIVPTLADIAKETLTPTEESVA